MEKTTKEVLHTQGMKVIERATGETKLAIYTANRLGNKQYNVDGKFYTDKQFDKLYGRITDDPNLNFCWKSHVRQLFDETLLNKECWILKQPFAITLHILGEMADYAAQIKDEKMIGYFCRLSLYKFSDPTDKEYDKERAEYYISQTTNAKLICKAVNERQKLLDSNRELKNNLFSLIAQLEEDGPMTLKVAQKIDEIKDTLK